MCNLFGQMITEVYCRDVACILRVGVGGDAIVGIFKRRQFKIESVRLSMWAYNALFRFER